MCEITLRIPDEALLALDTDAERLGDELRLAASMKLYELGRLSAGAAAQLAGIPKPVFLSKLADYGITSLRFDEDELRRDAESA